MEIKKIITKVLEMNVTNYLKLWLPGYDNTADIEKLNENFQKIDTKFEEQGRNLETKEPKFDKNDGFNLPKTNVPENNSGKLFTAKGALDLLNDITGRISTAISDCKSILRKEVLNIKSELLTLINRNTSKLENLQNTKEDKITRTHVPENDSNKVFTGKGAFDLKNWLVTNYTTLMNNIRDVLQTAINTKLAHGGYSGTAQTLLELINSKINKSNISNSVSSTSTANVASSQAVKIAYDKGVEAINAMNRTTLLFSGSSQSNVTLTQNWRDFKFLIIDFNYDAGPQWKHCIVVSTTSFSEQGSLDIYIGGDGGSGVVRGLLMSIGSNTQLNFTKRDLGWYKILKVRGA